MRIIPFERETIVLPVPPAEVIRLIGHKTQTHASDGIDTVFKGVIRERAFTVTLRTTRAQILIPQIHAEVESTSTGCIIFLKYRFFPATNFFLGFWTVLSLGIGLLFLGPANNYWYGCFSLAFCVANYVIAMANFEVHRQQIQNALQSVLEQLKS